MSFHFGPWGIPFAIRISISRVTFLFFSPYLVLVLQTSKLPTSPSLQSTQLLVLVALKSWLFSFPSRSTRADRPDHLGEQIKIKPGVSVGLGERGETKKNNTNSKPLSPTTWVNFQGEPL